jgi:hypothetical protein
MMLGVDYPHPDGTWGIEPGPIKRLQATVGMANVPPSEARLMLGQNLVELWGLDPEALQPKVERAAPTIADILKTPEKDEFRHGEVHKPMGASSRVPSNPSNRNNSGWADSKYPMGGTR